METTRLQELESHFFSLPYIHIPFQLNSMPVSYISMHNISLDCMPVSHLSIHNTSLDYMTVSHLFMHNISLDSMPVSHLFIHNISQIQIYKFPTYPF